MSPLRLPVLLYHHVGPPRAGANPVLTVPPDEFARQMEWLARHGFTTVTAAEWEPAGTLPERAVLLTFDDAYADLDSHALPLLRQHRFGATVFVVTSCIGKSSVWDEPLGWTPHPCLSAKRIAYWAGQGIEFGAHGDTHSDLTRLSPAALEQEIQTSARLLQELLGRAPMAFAYPFGRYNDAVRARVANTFAVAFTIEPGLNDAGCDPHTLRRNWVYAGDGVLDLRGRLRWGKAPVRGLRTRLQRLLGRNGR